MNNVYFQILIILTIAVEMVHLLASFVCIMVIQDSDSDTDVFSLLDPSTPGKVVGNISLSCSVEVYIKENKPRFCLNIIGIDNNYEKNLTGPNRNRERLCQTHFVYSGKCGLLLFSDELSLVQVDCKTYEGYFKR